MSIFSINGLFCPIRGYALLRPATVTEGRRRVNAVPRHLIDLAIHLDCIVPQGLVTQVFLNPDLPTHHQILGVNVLHTRVFY